MADAYDSRKIKHGEHLTAVDFFVGGFRPAEEQQAWLQKKANERKADADERARREAARTAAQKKLNES